MTGNTGTVLLLIVRGAAMLLWGVVGYCIFQSWHSQIPLDFISALMGGVAAIACACEMLVKILKTIDRALQEDIRRLRS